MKEILIVLAVWVLAVELSTGASHREYKGYVTQTQKQIDENIREELVQKMTDNTHF